MAKFMATVKRPGYARPVVIHMEAKTVKDAIDDMYAYAGAATARDIEEYELLQVIGDNRYQIVAYKGKPISASSLTLTTPKEYGEQSYKSYRDVA